MLKSTMDPVVKRAFGSASPKNPLHKLDDADRYYLCALLIGSSSGKRAAPFEPLDSLFQVAKDAAALSRSLRSDFFDDQTAKIMDSLAEDFRDLPERLALFADRLNGTLEAVGKRGHQRHTLVTRWLVEASEFVKLCTGQYFDEGLAEILQGAAPAVTSDCSGEAIHKKRKYLEKQYPEQYRAAVQSARLNWLKRPQTAKAKT